MQVPSFRSSSSLLTSLLLGHWTVPHVPIKTMSSLDAPFCPGQPVFHLDYMGTLSTVADSSYGDRSSESVQNQDVEVCASAPPGSGLAVGDPQHLPLYGKTARDCATQHRLEPMAHYNLDFRSAVHSYFSGSSKPANVYTFPPSVETVQRELDLLFFNSTRSLHIIGDSHQRNMYCGLVDISTHNCSDVLLNPKFMTAHHLAKGNIEQWYPSLTRPIHVWTDNLGFSKYDVPQGSAKRVIPPGVTAWRKPKTYNETIYAYIEALATCPGCIVAMNVGIHDMTSHTLAAYLKQYPSAILDDVFGQLEFEFMHNLEQLLQHVVKLGMKNRFVWVSGTPYEEEDTNWEKRAAKSAESLRRNFKSRKVVAGRRSTLKLSRWYRVFLKSKQLCTRLGLNFLDIFHPLSGPGFEQLRVPDDVHKKRFVWRAKAALLLQGLARLFEGDQSRSEMGWEEKTDLHHNNFMHFNIPSRDASPPTVLPTSAAESVFDAYSTVLDQGKRTAESNDQSAEEVKDYLLAPSFHPI